jgi:branched-chain amino acid transport system ATP-binding protein
VSTTPASPASDGRSATATATKAPPPEIRFSGVRAGYGRIEVLHGVDLTVPAGSVFALLGPNGAGKTTLLKVANGRIRLMAGSMTIEGLHVGRPTPENYARAGVCAIPEGRGIFPNLTVRDNIRVWTYQGGVTRAEAEERSYARFPRLKERRRQLAGTLSGGEQQMLAISRALVGQPRVLLLDEISMGLAPLIVAELYELVGHIAAEGVTVIVVEQFVTTALHVANRAAIMLHGRVQHEGTPEEMADAALGAYLSGNP